MGSLSRLLPAISQARLSFTCHVARARLLFLSRKFPLRDGAGIVEGDAVTTGRPPRILAAVPMPTPNTRVLSPIHQSGQTNSIKTKEGRSA